MKLIFVETEKDGHHLSLYARLLFKELTKENEIFLITNQKVLKSYEFKTLELFKKKIKIFTIKSQKKPTHYNIFSIFLFHLRNLVQIFSMIIKINKRFKVDKVYFNHLDPYLFIFIITNFFFNIKIKCSGLLLNIKFHQYFFKIRKYSILDTLKFFLFKNFILNKMISKVFIIDEQFLIFLKQKNFYSKKIYKISEALNKKTFKSTKPVKKNKNKINVLLYGSIDERKGIKLIKEINNNYEIKKKVFFTLAGKFDTKVLSFIKKNTTEFKNVKIINKFINDKLENKLFVSSDLIWLCYTSGSDGSSGVMQLATFYKKPILYSNRGLINYLATKYNLGFKIYLEKDTVDQFKSIFFTKFKLKNFDTSISKYLNSRKKNNFEKKISLNL